MEFTNSHYFKKFAESKKGKEEEFAYSLKGAKLSYSDLTPKKFKEDYYSGFLMGNIVGRTVRSLYGVAVAGVIKNIGQIFATVIVVPFKVFTSPSSIPKYLTFQVLKMTRNMGEAIGWTLTLVGIEKYGQFVVQVNVFNNELSDCILKDSLKSVYMELDYENIDFSIYTANNRPFSSTSADTKRLEEEAIRQVQKDPKKFYIGLSGDMVKNENVFLAALKACQNSDEARFVNHNFRGEITKKEVALASLKWNTQMFGKISEGLRKDSEIVIAALNVCEYRCDIKDVINSCDGKISKEAALFSLEKLDSIMLSDNIVHDVFDTLSDELKKEPEIVIAALNICKFKIDIKDVIDSCGGKISKEAALLSLKKSDNKIFSSFCKKLKENEEVVIAALNACKSNYDAGNVFLSCNKKITKTAALFAFKKFDQRLLLSSLFSLLGPDLKKDEDVVIAALKSCKHARMAVQVMDEYAGERTEKVIEAYLKGNPDFFQELSDEEKNKANFVAAALGGCKLINENPLESAKKVMDLTSIKIENNEQVLKSYLQIDPSAFLTLDPEKQSKKEIALTALQSCSTEEMTKKIMNKMESSLKEDSTIVFEIVKTNPVAFKFLNEEIKNNQQLALKAMSSSKDFKIKSSASIVFNSTPINLRNNEKNLEYYFNITPFIYFMLDDSLKKDKKIALAFIENLKSDTQAIWSSVPNCIKNDPEVKKKIKEKFPNSSFLRTL